MKTYKEILNNKSTQQIRLITIHNILKDVDMNLLIEKAKQIFIKQNMSILQVLCKYKIVQKNLFKWTELNSVRFYVIRKISTCQ